MARVGISPDPIKGDDEPKKNGSGSLSEDDLPTRKSSSMMYANDTIWARIAYSSIFQNATLVVIVLNAVWIGVDVQANHPVYKEQRGSDKLPLEPVSTVIEHLFCTYFSFELLVRFLSFRRKLDCFKDYWFIFDGLLVLFMVIETWILAVVGAIMNAGSDGVLSKFSALRLLRLLRLTRMTRIIREFPELITLLRGMLSATKAVGWILVFLLICQYVFAIIFVAQLGDPKSPEWNFKEHYWQADVDPTSQELFGTIGDAMMSLFTHGMLADNLAQAMQAIKDRGGDINPDCLEAIKKCVAELNTTMNVEQSDGPRICDRPDECESVREGGSMFLFWAFIAFMIISAFCLLNMLIGVLCEVITDSAAQESESTQISGLKFNMAQAFHTIDSSKDGLITAQEWEMMKDQETVRDSLASLGVDQSEIQHRLDQMAESLFGVEEMAEGEEDGRQGLTFDRFIDKVMEIRPDTDASALDIETLRVRVEREETVFNSRLDFIEEAVKELSKSDENALPVKGSSKVDPRPGSDEWLRDVPTEVLFAVLTNRAPGGASL